VVYRLVKQGLQSLPTK